MASTVNEEGRPVSALRVRLWNREDLEHVGLTLSTTSGKHDRGVGLLALEVQPLDAVLVVGPVLRGRLWAIEKRCVET
jgi:hypothetical protein